MAKRLIVLILAVFILGGADLSGDAAFTVNEAFAQTQGQVPGQALGTINDSAMWRSVRQGIRGAVSLPDKKAGVLVQSEGDNWRAINNGPLKTYGAQLLAATLVVLAAFFAIRRRIRIDAGFSGKLILRFGGLDRIAHWLTAVSFILLALTGLNVSYGRYVLKPLIGPDAFAALTQGGKYVHAYMAIVFTIGFLLMFVLWVRDNLPDRHDAGWLMRAGGMFSKGSHPPAGRFNTGQKLIFWTVFWGGLAHVLTGLVLLFPFAWTDMSDMQLAQILHSASALVMIAIIIAHIYIGSLGMEGAFDAMYSGFVDENWAREHHSAWVEDTEAKASTTAAD